MILTCEVTRGWNLQFKKKYWNAGRRSDYCQPPGYFLHSFDIPVQACLATWKFSYCWNCVQESKKNSLQHVWDYKEFGWKKAVIDAFSLRSIVVTLAAQPKSYYLALEVLEGKNVSFLWRAVWHRKTSPSIRLFLGTRTIAALFLQNHWNTPEKPSL